MSCTDHLSLVNTIRGVHEELRRHYHETKCNDGNKNADLTWNEHCSKDLRQYATAMEKLANTYWKQNNTSTRIDWCHKAIRSYYVEGGLQDQLERDAKIARTVNKDIDTRSSVKNTKSCSVEVILPITLLDVGSCFNPFKDLEDIFTIGIDLCPATADVFQCDFLKLQVTNESVQDNDRRNDDTKPLLKRNLPFPGMPLCTLPAGSFQAVVFSLLLEYLPCAHQRLCACLKARHLLADNGLLLVVTPDSKHESYNSRMMKSWRQALAALGLTRWRYEKTKHLHCMAFRKLSRAAAGNRRESATFTTDEVATEKLSSMLYIPQDFNAYVKMHLQVEDAENVVANENAEELLRCGFSELPSGY